MNKLKINKALAALMIIASIFADWYAILIVAALLLIFTEIEEDTKGILVSVIAFMLSITLLRYGWDLIDSLWSYVQTIITSLIGFINSYLDYANQITLTKLEVYFFAPIDYLFAIVSGAVNIIVLAAKIFFVSSLIFGKKIKPNAISNKIQATINKIINYVNSYGAAPAPAPAPAAPSAPVPPVPPVPPVTPASN